MRAFGSFALNSLRMEKGYRGAHELANDATPLDNLRLKA
jgi:glycine cleavage system aminomethyltransferase T